jgi:hypothetical protein
MGLRIRLSICVFVRLYGVVIVKPLQAVNGIVEQSQWPATYSKSHLPVFRLDPVGVGIVAQRIRTLIDTFRYWGMLVGWSSK